jgi:phosphotransferase system HPr-like phosphotransfer protein
MTKIARIDFYAVQMPESTNLSFEDLLTKVFELSETDRTQTVKWHPVRLHNISEVDIDRHKLIEGEIVRIRMNDLPPIAGLDGGVTDLKLKQDEGLGEQTAFLYHPKTQVLVFHTTQVGVSISSFLMYFRMLGKSIFNLTQDEIFADPLISEGALQKLARMKAIRKFEYKIRCASVNNPNFLKNEDLSLKEDIALISKFKSPTLSLALSVGHLKNDSLDMENTKSTIQSMLRLISKNSEEGEVTKIRISGSDEDNDNYHIYNLIKDVMRESVKLENNYERSLPYSVRRNALLKAWQKRQDEILRIRNSSTT